MTTRKLLAGFVMAALLSSSIPAIAGIPVMVDADPLREAEWVTPYGVDVYYAVVHSPFVMVTANNADDFFNAKSWLRTHGAKGVIRYQKSEFSWSGRNTDIYLSR